MYFSSYLIYFVNHIGDVMVDMLTLSTVFHDFKPRLCQTKDYDIGICYFFTNHITLRSKSNDWLALNQDNELSNMSISELQNNIPTKRVVLVHSGHHHVIECNLCVLFMISLKTYSFGIKQQSLSLIIC